MERILSLSVDERRFFRALIIPIIRNMLSTELSGATADFNTVTFHRGEVPPSDLLRRLRQDAIAVLYEYDATASSETERRELIALLSAAMTVRSSGRAPNPELAAIVYANATEIIAYFTAQMDRWPFELRQKIEHDPLWKYRHHGTAPPPELTNLEAEEARGRLIQSILAFRSKVNIDSSFTTYKLLVGFQSVFPPAWNDRKLDHAAEDCYRKAEIEKLILTMDMDNADDWLATIRRCAATQSEDLATFPNFAHFLERLANSKPEIMLFYLRQLDSRLANFLTPMICRLSQTQIWPTVQELITSWIASHRFLADIAWAWGNVVALDLDTFEAIVEDAVDTRGDRALRSCIRSISWRDDANDAPRLKALLLKLIAYFAEQGDATWIRAWFSRHDRARLGIERARAIADTRVSGVLSRDRSQYRVAVARYRGRATRGSHRVFWASAPAFALARPGY